MVVSLNKRIVLLVAVILGVAAVSVSLVVHMYKPLPADYFLELKLKVVDKPNLLVLYSKGNLSVVDCSVSGDGYRSGEHLPGAVWSLVPSMFYGYDHTIVVYSVDDNVSKAFCFDLLRHGKENVFLFKGGYGAWKE